MCDHNHYSRLRKCSGLLSTSLSVLVDSKNLRQIFLSSHRRSLAADQYRHALLFSVVHLAWLHRRVTERFERRQRIDLRQMLKMRRYATTARASLQSLSKMRLALRSSL